MLKDAESGTERKISTIDRQVGAIKHFDVGIVGLGYVGLTLGTALADVGCRVLGVERRQDVVRLTNEGRAHCSESGLDDTLSRVVRPGQVGILEAVGEFPADTSCDVYIITVGTPLDSYGFARTDMIESATSEVADHMQPGALVILRSTVKIGTTRGVVAPILRRSGKPFDLAMCPERTLEGRALTELRTLPQIIGADNQATADRAANLFRRMTTSIVQVDSPESAEIIKLVDNTYRDVRFAFANEVARLCDAFGVNAYEVISSGKLGYSRTDVPLPGPVGGPCLEKDPHILYQSALDRGIELDITKAGRVVNERQPSETVDQILAESARRGLAPDGRVALLGMAFKGVPATDDLRGSMSLKILAALESRRPGIRVALYDPVVDRDSLVGACPGHIFPASLEEAVDGASIVIIANNHAKFTQHTPATILDRMVPNGFVYDYWNHFSGALSAEWGQDYFALGSLGAAHV